MPEQENRPTPTQETEEARVNPYEANKRDADKRNFRGNEGLNLGYYALANDLLKEEVLPDVGELGHSLITMWLDGQVSPHSGTEISSFGTNSLMDSLGTRMMVDGFIKERKSHVDSSLNNLSESLTDKNLASAIAKQKLVEVLNQELNDKLNEKGKKGRTKEVEIPESAEMNQSEYKALILYERKIATIKIECDKCGSFGKTLEAKTTCRTDIVEDSALLDSGLITDKGIVDKVKARLEQNKKNETRLIVKMGAEIELLEESIDNSEKGGNKWLQLINSINGATSVFNGCNEWLKNGSDLEPIGRMWENQGRMESMHPSNLIEVAKRYPSFNEGFRGIAALGSGKYAIGSNGEIYPTGAYGLGYVDKNTGKIVDVDKAYRQGSTSRTERDLVDGIVRLNENQIWVRGQIVEVNERRNPDKKAEEDGIKFNGYNGKVIINGESVEIFSKNILYWEGIHDENVSDFFKGVVKFVKGLEKHNGGKSSETDIDLGVQMARSFYEMSMLSNWNGVPRDSQGKPYYGEYKYSSKGGKVKRNVAETEMDMWKISTDPESRAVKVGVVANGWDEGSLFPSYVNDWGKLTLTRFKQSNELFKGRKHGLNTLVSVLPESLAKPLLNVEDNGENMSVDAIVRGEKSLIDAFQDMRSVGKLKLFWLDIAKSISVYEFVSSQFVGDKDVYKANEDLLAFLTNPRNLEGVNKNIDLSLLYVDPWEAARLKVNIVTAAIASVAREFNDDEFLQIGPKGILQGRLNDKNISSAYNEKLLRGGNDSTDSLKSALSQLAVSRFVGDEGDVNKILEKLSDFRAGKTELGFSIKELKNKFGSDYLDHLWNEREEKRNKVIDRGKRGSR